MEFLSCLGWPILVSSHAGWTGHTSTSWSITTQTDIPQLDEIEHGGSLYNGNTHALYWADVSSEIAFIVPTLNTTVVAEPEPSYGDNSNNGKKILILINYFILIK